MAKIINESKEIRLFVFVPTFDCPQHPEVYTVHQSSGVFIAVPPQVRPVPSCHHDRGAPLTLLLGHPQVRKRINIHTCCNLQSCSCCITPTTTLLLFCPLRPVCQPPAEYHQHIMIKAGVTTAVTIRSEYVKHIFSTLKGQSSDFSITFP